MNPSRVFIERPVATILLMAALLLSGLVAYRALPISALPQIEYPTIQVVTLYPGASPEVVTSTITAPLERQFGQMPGLNQMSSTSSGGASVITLRFVLTLSLDVAEQEVQAAINAAQNLLPNDLPTPPIFSKVNPADAPILTLAVTSKTLTLAKLQELVDTRLAQKISQQPGVGLVSMGGGQRPAIRIQINPTAAAAYQLSLENLRTAIASANVNLPKGSFDGAARTYTIDANDQLRSAAQYAQVIVAYQNSRPVRLGDVAEVRDDIENRELAAWANTAPAIIVNVQRQPGTNVIEVADRVKALLPGLEASFPVSAEIIQLTDRTTTVRTSVHAVQIEMAIAVVLVVAVIMVFLRSVAATLIPAVAVPLSLIGTCGFLYLAGFSLNNLTLMALTIATGFVVDDAIVVIENIKRHLDAGATAEQAALDGSTQIGFTIISLTISLLAVLIPVLFMGDVVGRLFREFAITLAVAILLSGVISLTLTPMLCARLLHPTAASHSFFDSVATRYGALLNWVLDRQLFTLLVAAVVLALTVGLYAAAPKGFFPVQDTGVIQAISEAPQSISFSAMAREQQALARVILTDPAVASLSSSVGVDGANVTLNSGRMLINLVPRAARDADIDTVIHRLQEAAAKTAGMTVYLQPVQDLTIEDRVSRTRFQLTLETPHANALATWTQRLVERLHQTPEVIDVASDLQERGLGAYVMIDRDAAGRLGVTATDIDNALYNAFAQRLISTIYTQSNQYRVVLEVNPRAQAGLRALQDIHVSAPNGAQIPLAAIAKVVERPTSLVINHLGQFPAATVSFNLAPGVALGAAVAAIEAAEREIGIPIEVQTAFQGAALAFSASLTNTLWLLLGAIVTVYIVLGVLYESFVHPVTILSTLPSAGVGALIALRLSHADLDIVAIIGLILLIGIVKKNAILIIDFALDAERNGGKSPREAIHAAAILRLRPILMTTLSALFGALPLMLGTGVGSELRHPLGITIVGGLLLSQVLTLFTTPVIYLGFDRLARRLRNRLAPERDGLRAST